MAAHWLGCTCANYDIWYGMKVLDWLEKFIPWEIVGVHPQFHTRHVSRNCGTTCELAAAPLVAPQWGGHDRDTDGCRIPVCTENPSLAARNPKGLWGDYHLQVSPCSKVPNIINHSMNQDKYAHIAQWICTWSWVRVQQSWRLSSFSGSGIQWFQRNKMNDRWHWRIFFDFSNWMHQGLQPCCVCCWISLGRPNSRSTKP